MLQCSVVWARMIILMLKQRDPKIEPWGTPYLVSISDKDCSVLNIKWVKLYKVARPCATDELYWNNNSVFANVSFWMGIWDKQSRLEHQSSKLFTVSDWTLIIKLLNKTLLCAIVLPSFSSLCVQANMDILGWAVKLTVTVHYLSTQQGCCFMSETNKRRIEPIPSEKCQLSYL